MSDPALERAERLESAVRTLQAALRRVGPKSPLAPVYRKQIAQAKAAAVCPPEICQIRAGVYTEKGWDDS